MNLTLEQFVDLRRENLSKRRFLAWQLGFCYSRFRQVIRGERPPTQALILAIRRHHIAHHAGEPLRLALTVSGVPAVVELYLPPAPRRRAEDEPAAWEKNFEHQRQWLAQQPFSGNDVGETKNQKTNERQIIWKRQN